MAESNALVVAPDSVLPVFGGAQMGQALTAYKDLQRALDDGMPECIMEIPTREGTKKFRKKSYWRAVATAFNLNVECVKEERQQTNGTFVYLATYRATTPSGRTADGDGACSSAEKSVKQATEHNVRSHCHTRAFNRAVSNIVGFGEVSAEEVDREEGEVVAHVAPQRQPETPRVTTVVVPKAPSAPKAASGPSQILNVKDVKPAAGKSGSKYYQIFFEEKLGSSDRDMATTFDEADVEVAIQSMRQSLPVQATLVEKENGFWNIKKGGLVLLDAD
jgi:hypothetical protein